MARDFDEETGTSTEPQVSSTVTETETAVTSGEAGTEVTATDEATTPAQPEKPVDTTDYEELFEKFKVTVGETVSDSAEGRDLETGTLPASLIEPIKALYGDLNTRTRTVVRDWFQAEMSDAMTGQGNFAEPNFAAARSLMELLQAVKASAPKVTVTKAPVDPTVAHVARVAALMLSPNLVVAPEGVATNWGALAQAKVQELTSQVIAYRDWLAENASKPTEEQTAAPEVDEIVLSAANIAKGRSPKAAKPREPKVPGAPKAPRQPSVGGVRRDIAAHIREAFEGHPAGTFLSIGEICKFSSSEYGDDHPSQGAVAARLFPGKNPVELEAAGVQAEEREKKGAVKL